MKTPAIALLLAASVAACGSSTSNDSAGSQASSPSAATSSSTSAAAITISTASVTGVGTVLVDSGGRTLYRFTPDAGGQIACTGACATNWPPVIVPQGESVQGGAGLSGKFGTMARPDGTMQATYNSWPLYAFAGDTAAGTANGQGKLGKWFAVTPDVAAPGAAASPTM